MSQQRSAGGFSLIELMTVVAVVAILAAIAYPSYEDSLVKSRRKTATACLSEASQYMERYYTTNMRYTTDADCKVAPALPGMQCQTDLGEHYNFALSGVTCAAFTVEADPKGRQKTKDTACGKLTLDQTGLKGENGSADAASCW